MNRNLGRFYTHMAFKHGDTWIVEDGNGKGFEIKVIEKITYCEVLVFAPEFANEDWAILLLKYSDYEDLSGELSAKINWLAKKLHTTVIEESVD